jgi:Leucine-rich repeat (LRR) protein
MFVLDRIVMHRRRDILLSPLIVGLSLLAGCGPNSGSAPTYEQRVAAQEGAAAALNAKGKVEQKKYPPGMGNAVTLKGATITDADIKSLREINNLTELDLSGSTVTDIQIAQLVDPDPTGRRPAAQLFRIDLSETNITDDGLKELAALDILSEINLKNSQVTNAGIEEFQKLRSGKRLPFGMKLKITK